MITMQVDVNQSVDVDIHVSDVIYALNRLPLLQRWSQVGNILTHLKLNGIDEDGDKVKPEEVLNDEQKEIRVKCA